MRGRPQTITVALLCLIGGGLLLWPYEDDRSLWWFRSHLEIVDGQLQGLKDLLQDFKKTNGRYPTNDEGLAVLDNFESRFTVSYYRPLDTRRYEAPGFYGDDWSDFWWLRSKQDLNEFRKQHGRAPSNQEELSEIGIGMGFRDWGPSREFEDKPTQVEFAIDRHDNIFLVEHASVLSPWLLPYNYENRDDGEAGEFQHSLANGDRWGYSTRVDDGVYVSSTGGYLYSQDLRLAWWKHYWPRFLGVILILCGIAVAFWNVVRVRRKRPLLTIIAVIPGFLAGAFWYFGNRATCYIMVELFARRTPEMVSLQMELLDKYRENGVISEDTYRRAVSAVERSPEESVDAVESGEP